MLTLLDYGPSANCLKVRVLLRQLGFEFAREPVDIFAGGARTDEYLAFNPAGVNDFFTAMPIQIFDWISRPSNDVNDYRPLAAAGILLLMILLLAMNSIAIWLRNRYEQKW